MIVPFINDASGLENCKVRKGFWEGCPQGRQHRAVATGGEGAAPGGRARRIVRVHGPDQLLQGRIRREAAPDRQP